MTTGTGAAASLEDIIFAKSFGRGAVTLASGKRSDFYFDMKPSMLDPRGALLIAQAIHAEARALGASHVGGLEMGAVPITGAVCLYSATTDHPVEGFFVRKKPKEHGARKLVEGLKKGDTLAGRRVIVVEDVTTTGGSALVALEAVKMDGAVIAGVVTIVDRQDGAEEAFAAAGVPFRSLFKASAFLARKA
ncbi:MAG: orotate phosphoribosyltransferase [Hyphomicrobiales bacterium]|nr:orotate phosphoribosyltransferase [Hyphomicrobiales bacterium]